MRLREAALLFSLVSQAETGTPGALAKGQTLSQGPAQSGEVPRIELALRLASPFGLEDACSTWYSPAKYLVCVQGDN